MTDEKPAAMNHIAPRKLLTTKADNAERVLLSFSNPTMKPLAKATVKGACGAWSETNG